MKLALEVFDRAAMHLHAAPQHSVSTTCIIRWQECERGNGSHACRCLSVVFWRQYGLRYH
jgi:hypothetical protein